MDIHKYKKSFLKTNMKQGEKMKNYLILALVLMVGMVTANDNSAAPDGFVPEIGSSVASGVPQITVDDGTDGEYITSARTAPYVPSGTDGFTFTVVNWSLVSWLGTGNPLRGLDIVSYSGENVMSPRDSLYIVNIDNGTKIDAFPLASANTYAYGSYPYSSINTNDCSNTNMYNSVNIGASWTAHGNPAGDDGRGMDVNYSTSTVWETYSNQGVYSFSHLSSTGTFHDLSADLPGQLSGLTIYNHGGYNYLVVTAYSYNYAYFFDMDNNLNYIGAAAFPYGTFYKSYGIAYCSSRDTFFWSFKNTSNNCYLIELQLDVTSLDQSTWGDIKSSF
jgi:hypothetical protein